MVTPAGQCICGARRGPGVAPPVQPRIGARTMVAMALVNVVAGDPSYPASVTGVAVGLTVTGGPVEVFG
jgi:hypothetical protein